MRIGKLTNEELKDIVLSRLPKLSERTLIGANIGADCAWLDLGDKLLVTSSDPVVCSRVLCLFTYPVMISLHAVSVRLRSLPY